MIEDPYGKDSAETLPIQACDVAAYFLIRGSSRTPMFANNEHNGISTGCYRSSTYTRAT